MPWFMKAWQKIMSDAASKIMSVSKIYFDNFSKTNVL